MNPRWLLVRRLRGPAFLLTFGVTALLNQWDVLSFWQSWPLYLIVAGVLTLAERAVLASVPYDAAMGAPMGAPYGVPYGQPAYPAPSQPPYQPGTSVVPAPPSGIQGNDPGGRR